MFMPSPLPIDSPVNLDRMPREVLVATLKEVLCLPFRSSYDACSSVLCPHALEQFALCEQGSMSPIL